MGQVVALHNGDWAARIAAAWASGAQAVISTGKLLIEAKRALAHGEFEKMCRERLPFSARTAQRLMRIAEDERLSNPTISSLLPPDWTTIYDLTRLNDDELKARVADGTIRPDMAGREIKAAVKKTIRATREMILGGKIAALPQEKFGVIVADPEWRFEPWSRATGMDRAADNHYPTSCMAVIASRDVPSVAADDCVLFLWATIPMLPHALLVMAAWGFDYKSNYVWGKDKAGTGYWNREKHEHWLIGTRGNVVAPAMGDQSESLINAPRGKHSEKPETFLELIERWYPNTPKIELNRRGVARSGWKAWGNEAAPTHDPETGEIIESDVVPRPSTSSGPASVSIQPADAGPPYPPTADGGEPPEALQTDPLDLPNFLRRDHPDCPFRSPLI